jgi:hypothetical protein
MGFWDGLSAMAHDPRFSWFRDGYSVSGWLRKSPRPWWLSINQFWLSYDGYENRDVCFTKGHEHRLSFGMATKTISTCGTTVSGAPMPLFNPLPGSGFFG